MSEPHQPHTPAATNLAWIGGAGVAAGLSWIVAAATVALTHRASPAVGMAAVIVAATVTVVFAILAARYRIEASNADDHAQILTDLCHALDQNMVEHAQLVALIQKLEAKVNLLAQHLPKALEDEKWNGYADAAEDRGGAEVIGFPRRA